MTHLITIIHQRMMYEIRYSIDPDATRILNVKRINEGGDSREISFKLLPFEVKEKTIKLINNPPK
jgi:hypothetical protein